eukprot:gb/GECG01013161.1/.p1 GENE.gb/GECG01013161.1/~~gb/GECG01013161.1/.p1  ORF type:complete len:324 (+),score=41.63 gb/GECG01013161.1/:1-972(+)
MSKSTGVHVDEEPPPYVSADEMDENVRWHGSRTVETPPEGWEHGSGYPGQYELRQDKPPSISSTALGSSHHPQPSAPGMPEIYGDPNAPLPPQQQHPQFQQPQYFSQQQPPQPQQSPFYSQQQAQSPQQQQLQFQQPQYYSQQQAPGQMPHPPQGVATVEPVSVGIPVAAPVSRPQQQAPNQQSQQDEEAKKRMRVLRCLVFVTFLFAVAAGSTAAVIGSAGFLAGSYVLGLLSLVTGIGGAFCRVRCILATHWFVNGLLCILAVAGLITLIAVFAQGTGPEGGITVGGFVVQFIFALLLIVASAIGTYYGYELWKLPELPQK